MTHRNAVANIALALALLASLLWRWRARKAGEGLPGPFRRVSPLHGPVALFVLLSLLAVPFSTDAPGSAVAVKGLLTFLLVALVAGLVEDGDDAHLVVDALRLTTLYLVLRGLVDWFVLGHDNVWERLSGGLSIYMTYAGLLMVLSLVLAARALTAGRPGGSRLADGILSVAGAVLVGLTFTRNAYLGLAVGILVLVLTARPRLSLVLPPLAVALVLVLPAGVKERAATTFDRTDAAARDRLAMWTSGAEMIAQRPFFGVGPGRIKELYPLYRQPGFVEASVGHLHNNVVNVAAETGLPSALAYLAIVVAAFVATWPLARERSRPDVRALARGALAANAALFTAGLFEYNFGDSEILRLMLVVLALPFAAARAERAPLPADP
jgi:O-antigen ligase